MFVRGIVMKDKFHVNCKVTLLAAVLLSLVLVLGFAMGGCKKETPAQPESAAGPPTRCAGQKAAAETPLGSTGKCQT